MFIVYSFVLITSINQAQADIYQSGEATLVFGCDGGSTIIQWELKYTKSPTVAKKTAVWMHLNIKPGQASTNCTFVICAMLNLNKPKISVPAYHADLSSGTWTCTSTGTVNWHPNFHLGCKRVILTGSTKNNIFDQDADFTVDFTESEIAAAYIDFAQDCPNGFSGCGALFDKADQWLVPGTGGVTASFWVTGFPVIKCPTPELIEINEGRIPFSPGNWWTMGFPENTYESVLVGTLTNAPIGAEIRFEFPPSTGAGTQQFTITENPTNIIIPYTLSSAIDTVVDEHIYYTIKYHESLNLPNPDKSIRFLGEVKATNTTLFPSGDTLYKPGDFMHGVDLQFLVEYEPPFLTEHRLTPIDRGRFQEIAITAGDRHTSVVSASLTYFVDGALMPDISLPYNILPAETDAGPVIGAVTKFKTILGPYSGGSKITKYVIHIKDHARNVSHFEFIPPEQGPPPRERLIIIPNPAKDNIVARCDLGSAQTARLEIGGATTGTLEKLIHLDVNNENFQIRINDLQKGAHNCFLFIDNVMADQEQLIVM